MWQEMFHIWMITAVICAFIVKGMCGFANTLVFDTILSFRMNNINITPVELLTGYPSNFIVVWKERKALSMKVWGPLALLVIAGSIPGALFLKNGDTTTIKLIFGFVVVCIGIEMFFREYQKNKKKTSPVVLGIIGVASGLLCGLFGIGALLAAYVSRTTDENSAFCGNLCMVFIIENTFRIIFYISCGIITLSVAQQALVLIPFMLIGLGVGMLLAKVLPEKVVKQFVIVMLVLSGISLILHNIAW